MSDREGSVPSPQTEDRCASCGAPLFPQDVKAWLEENYTPEGIGIWFAAYAKADQAKREHMLWIARGDGMGL